MAKYVIVGAGATGRAVAAALAQQADEIVVVSRSGTTVAGDNVRAVAAHAGDAAALSDVAQGADALFNCANPPYNRWLTDWPPIASALLHAARTSGAVLTTLSNLYAYGQPHGPMRPSDPLSSTLPKAMVRASMWADALAAHERGEIRATEVRASDFIGAGSQSFFERGKKSLLAGKSVTVIGDPDVTHSWTFVGDVGATLVAAATNPQAWGRPWHAVTNEPRTMREVLTDIAQAAGVAEPRLRRLSVGALRAVGLVMPLVRELPKTLYQFESPFVIDDRETRAELGLAPTSWDAVVADVLH